MGSDLTKFNPSYFYCFRKVIILISHQIFLRIKPKLINKYPLKVPELLLPYPGVTTNFGNSDFNC